MMRSMVLVGLLGVAGAAQAGQPATTSAFESLRALELKALEARSTILAQERGCTQAASTVKQLRTCREQAQAAREALGQELRPQYERLVPSRAGQVQRPKR